MICLHCGHCCLQMSPLGSPCPKLVNHGSFYFCSDYTGRPEECRNHKYPFSICPIGVEKLNITNHEQLQRRIDTGYAMLKYNTEDPEKAYRVLINAY